MSISTDVDIRLELCVIYRQYERFLDEVAKLQTGSITKEQRDRLIEAHEALDKARRAFTWVTP